MLFTFAAGTSLAGTLLISEFRLRGLNGPNDEFVEIYNTSGEDHTVASISGTGYAIAASDGVVRCTIPNGTIIPQAGHFLCVNSAGYSLGTYPAGNGTTATGDATYTTDIPDNAGIALFNNNIGGSSFTLANRFDAAGSTSEASALYREGVGLPTITPFSINYAFVRDQCGKGGAVNDLGPCTIETPKDTDDNAADFLFVDTSGTSAGAGQRLGAPGPQNLSSPVSGGSAVSQALLDSCAGPYTAPNVVRDLTSDVGNNSMFGTLDFRFTFTNNSGGNLNRLRFRIVDLNTFPATGAFADLRPRTSSDVVVNVDRPPCGSGNSNVTVRGTTLEQPPAQPNGGGFNSSMGVGAVTLGTPIANGATIDVHMLMGIQHAGDYRIGIIPEGLPVGGDVFMVTCNTETVCAPALLGAVSRKVHGAAGTFDLLLSSVATNPATEPRQGPTATIVMNFDMAIISANVAIPEGTAIAGLPTFSGNNVIVNLTGVTDQQYVTISLTNVSSATLTGGSGSVRLGFLTGDVNGNRVVTLADLGLVNAQLAQTVTATNYLKDVNASGTLTLADKGITNTKLTHALPTP